MNLLCGWEQEQDCKLESYLLTVINKLLLNLNAPGVERSLVYPSLPVDVLGVEQEEVIEGLQGKVKGLEQTILCKALLRQTSIFIKYKGGLSFIPIIKYLLNNTM